jgi:F-type H+-transporting ATPase subunit gamma
MAQQLSLRHIKSRIASVDSIKKVTHAMEMVAVAKLRGVEEKFAGLREYYGELDNILSGVLYGAGEESHPLLAKRKEKNRSALCVVTSDTGLCGAYNSGVLALAGKYLAERGEKNIDVIAVGRKGFNFFRKKKINAARSFVELGSMYPDRIFAELSGALAQMYLSGAVDEVNVAYMKFESKSRSKAVMERYLGLDDLKPRKTRYIFDGGVEDVMKRILSMYLLVRMKVILYNAYAVEQAYRMVSMEEATKNAKELQEGLILLRNKVRQASITKEILEISSSAEILR